MEVRAFDSHRLPFIDIVTSAFVGLGAMAVLILTVPGYLTAKVRGFEVEKLMSTDQRTATVIEGTSWIKAETGRLIANVCSDECA
jgi:hypothetical protein